VSTNEPITLGKTHLAYILLTLLVVLPGIMFLVFSNAIAGLWCERFELPKYEKALGFKMERRAWGATGNYHALAISWVGPGGTLGQAGFRPGDVPRTYHGVGDLCSALSSASAGAPVQLEVTNLDDQPSGQRVWRVVTIPARPR